MNGIIKENMYWILARNIMMIIIARLLPFVLPVPKVHSFNLKTIQIINGLISMYVVLVLGIQNIITLYYIIKEKDVPQNNHLRIHNTYGICLLFLIQLLIYYL